MVLLFLVVACAQDLRPAPPPRAPQPPPLVIPANDPSWPRLAGFLDDPRAYGEAGWDDVRMRAVQHAATIGRDRARGRAMVGDWPGCAAQYEAAAVEVAGIGTRSSTGQPIKAALVAGLRRDGEICAAVGERRAPSPGGGEVAPHWAAFVAGLAGVDVVVAAPKLSNLDLDNFSDFQGRHRLRVALVEAYIDAVDPFYPSEPWGYWSPTERQRTLDALAAGRGQRDPLWASRRVADRAPVEVEAHQLGDLPTGDSLVDVGAFAGPRAIGSLAVRDVTDPAHRAWLDAEAAKIDAAPDAAAMAAALTATVAALDAHPEGSRYYNVKQARNAAVRALASRGHYAAADALLAANWPLHAQDWACPNREGILLALRGRVQLLAAAPTAAPVLAAAAEATRVFVAHTLNAEARRARRGPP